MVAGSVPAVAFFFPLGFRAGCGGLAGSSGSSGVWAFALGPRFLGNLPDEGSDVMGFAVIEGSVLSRWVAVAACVAFVFVWAFLPLPFPPWAFSAGRLEDSTSLVVVDIVAPCPGATVDAIWSTAVLEVVAASAVLVCSRCILRLVGGLNLLFKVAMGYPFATLKLLLNSIGMRSSTEILHCFA